MGNPTRLTGRSGERGAISRLPLQVVAWLTVGLLVISGRGGRPQDVYAQDTSVSPATDSNHPTQNAPSGGTLPPAFSSVPKDVQIGDPQACYWNPEFSSEGNYAIWFEPDQPLTPQLRGRMWHCAVNRDTGELNPPDCKGFQAFAATLPGHANFGSDDQGPYYLGANLQGQLVMVRPTGSQTGQVTVLGTAPDMNRRAIYPSHLPNADKRYVYWIKSIGGNNTPGHSPAVELRYLDLADSTKEITVVHQTRPSIGWTPLDVGFVRWFSGTTQLVFGSWDANQHVQMTLVDVAQSPRTMQQITDDPHDKLDAWPFTYQGHRYLLPGLDRTATSQLYAETEAGSFFEPLATITPPNSSFTAPCLAQSNETFEFGGTLYSAYQISDCSSGGNFYTAPGEVWLSTLFTTPQQQWRLSQGGNLVNNEPEPLVGNSRAWVFYSSYPSGQTPGTVCPQLRRVELKPNQPPVLASPGNQTVAEGAWLAFTLQGSDPDGDALTYGTVDPLPAGAQLDPHTGQFTWTPSYQQAGAYTLTFTATDGHLTTLATIQLTVLDVNQPPVFPPIGDKSVQATALLTFTVSATDPEGAPLTFQAANLPPGASFEPAAATFNWTPTSAQAGVYPNVRFQVSDGHNAVPQYITITVQPTTFLLGGRVTALGKPVPHVAVQLWQGSALVGTSLTDAAGRYQFLGLANGSYTVRPKPSAFSGWFVPASRTVILATTDQTNINFTQRTR